MDGNALRAWRLSHRLSQAELAKKLFVSPLTVLRWENGQSPLPPRVTLAGLQAMLDPAAVAVPLHQSAVRQPGRPQTRARFIDRWTHPDCFARSGKQWVKTRAHPGFYGDSPFWTDTGETNQFGERDTRIPVETLDDPRQKEKFLAWREQYERANALGPYAARSETFSDRVFIDAWREDDEV